ncbi:MAG: hypothetical protein AB2A00_25200 [Myxococcota bacterium]
MKRTRRLSRDATLHAAQEFGRALTAMAEILQGTEGADAGGPAHREIPRVPPPRSMFSEVVDWMRGRWSAVLAVALLAVGTLALARRKH